MAISMVLYRRYGDLGRWYAMTDVLDDAIWQPGMNRQAREVALMQSGYITGAREFADDSPRALNRAREAYVKAMRQLAGDVVGQHGPTCPGCCDTCFQHPCRCGDEQEFVPR